MSLSCTRRRCGFTLLELLVATLAFAILLGVLYTLFFGVVRLRNAADDATEKAAPTLRLVQALRSDLENAVVPAGILSGALTIESSDNGDFANDTITFCTTTGIVSDAKPWAEVQKIEFYLEESDDGSGAMDLVRLPTRNLLASTIDEEEEQEARQIVARNVAGLSIEAWDGTDWVGTWDSSSVDNENPAGIRVRIDFDDVAPRSPITIIAPIGQQPRPAPAGAVSTQSGDGEQTGLASGGASRT